MTRRITTLAVAVAALSMTLRLHARSPNIVVILADDLGWMDLRCQGNQLVDTPHLDRLAAQGMRFTDAYAAAPVCTPTRAAMMTGLAPARLRTTNHAPGNPEFVSPRSGLRGAEWTTYLPLEHETIAERLAEAGYATGFFGKWHLSHRRGRDVAGPHEPGLRPEHQGFDLNVGGCSYGGPPSYFAPYRIPAMRSGPRGEYLPDRLARECIEFVEASGERPFFVCWWMYSVHYPFEAPERLIEKYRERAGPDPAGGPPMTNPVYAAMLEGMDAAIGKLLAHLDERGLADETFVLFTSDNGPFAIDSRPLRGEKGHLLEGGIRVPWIVRWPGRVAPRSICRTPVITTDAFPTLLEVAGMRPRSGQPLDGVSILRLLEGTAPLARDTLYFHYPNFAFHKSNRLASAIREGAYKLIRYHDDDSVELFHLNHDIGEHIDLARFEPDRAARMRAKLDRWLSETGAALPTRVR